MYIKTGMGWCFHHKHLWLDFSINGTIDKHGIINFTHLSKATYSQLAYISFIHDFAYLFLCYMVCYFFKDKKSQRNIKYYKCNAHTHTKVQLVIPNSSVIKESACNAQDQGSILGSGVSPGEVNGNPLQYSCLENPTDREAWQAIVRGLQESDMT